MASFLSPPKRVDFSVVIPVYQEEQVIESTLEELFEVLHSLELSYEVWVVDDGSTDGTKRILESLQKKYPNELRVLHHAYNRGNGAAVKSGLLAARSPTVACMDADGQHDPRDLPKLLSFAKDYDLVVGARIGRSGGPWHRYLINRFYNLFASWMTRFPIQDLTSGFRIFNRSAVRPFLDLFPLRFSYPVTTTLLFLKAGHSIRYVPVHSSPRRANKSKIRLLSDGPKFLIIIFKIMVIFEPLRIFLPAAAFLFLLALLTTAHSIWVLNRFYLPNASVVFFVTSILVLLLGLLAEQIAALRIPIQTERRSDD